ncbi:MAG TPA: type II toxin-antitoxin system VapC family toxin [Acidimicrobiales bacterium]|nr:type II toxin-antitoxin system VapC family toxin [Acidimicrobiales bacterium]
MIVVDTNVVAELMRPEPNEVVRRWSLAQQSGESYTTAITLAEILYGIERLPSGRRKDLLRATASDIFSTFGDRVLPFDADAAAQYPLIVEGRDRLGRPIEGFDAQIASICRVGQAALATRNVKDFEHTGIEVVDPWLAQ